MSETIEMPKPEREKATKTAKLSEVAMDLLHSESKRGETYSETIIRVFKHYKLCPKAKEEWK